MGTPSRDEIPRLRSDQQIVAQSQDVLDKRLCRVARQEVGVHRHVADLVDNPEQLLAPAGHQCVASVVAQRAPCVYWSGEHVNDTQSRPALPGDGRGPLERGLRASRRVYVHEDACEIAHTSSLFDSVR